MSKIQPQPSGTRIAKIRTASWTGTTPRPCYRYAHFFRNVQTVLGNCRNFAPKNVNKVLKSCSVSKTLPSKTEKVALKPPKIGSFVYCNLDRVFNHSFVVTPTTTESGVHHFRSGAAHPYLELL